MSAIFIRYWLIFRLAITTLYSCSLVIIASLLGFTRTRIDRYIRSWARRMLEIIELDYQIYDPYKLKLAIGKPYMVMFNHTSLYDIPLSAVAIDGSMRMVAKKELFYVPVFGYALKKSEFIFIDRKNPRQAVKDLKLAAAKIRDGITIWYSPEGTRSADGTLLPFKTGGFKLALETGATIIPLGIRGATKLIEHKTFKINRRQCVEVHIGKPIDASQYIHIQPLMADVATAIKVAAAIT